MSNITATLTDNTGTLTLPDIEVPLKTEFIDIATDVVTVSNDLYTDLVGNRRRRWTFNYSSLTEQQYDDIKAYYDNQFVTYQYPTLSIPFYSVTDVIVRMNINDQDVYNDCGNVENVIVTFRETAQLPEGS